MRFTTSQCLVFALALVAIVVEALDGSRRAVAIATPEHGIFGCSSTEDYLFGASSVLNRHVRFTGGDYAGGTSQEEVTSEEQVTAMNTNKDARPAFVLVSEPSDNQ